PASRSAEKTRAGILSFLFSPAARAAGSPLCVSVHNGFDLATMRRTQSLSTHAGSSNDTLLVERFTRS
ncbi:hypothetical protein AUN00_16635, partial [Cronobacter sakazakii]